MEGFLCIENAREHPQDAALFSTLIPYMLMERERFREDNVFDRAIRRLIELPDKTAYLKAAHALTSERLTSLGVVCLETTVAGNGDMSPEEGGKMLWQMAKALLDMFSPTLVFRIWDTEFVAFLPNTTREVFLGRCSRLSSSLRRRYQGKIRFGRAWAEGVFTGTRLVKEARCAMKKAAAKTQTDIQKIVESVLLASRGEGELAENRLTVYLQPKINLLTGELAGAEALVRGIADDGSIIAPSRFIGLLEEDGIIRTLDLMVLDYCLAQAERWRKDGLGTVSIAVNLSRATLAHPSTLASILALQSHYPDYPSEALELEITERGEEIDNAELQAMVAQYHECGLRVSLDDFGSQYANLYLFTSVKFDAVKLDRSLIAEVVSNPISRTLVRDIIQICQSNAMECVAEGVENEEQNAMLLEMGCSCAQGYYYGKPVSMTEFEKNYLRQAAGVPQEGQGEECT